MAQLSPIVDPFVKECLETGKVLAMKDGKPNEYKEYALAYFTLRKQVDKVLRTYVDDNREKWDALSTQDKADISAKLIRALTTKKDVDNFMSGKFKL